MDNQIRAAKLKQAAELVREVEASLDHSVRECPSCHIPVQNNRAHFQMGIEMQAIDRKLSKFAERFRRNMDFWNYE